MAIIRLFVVLFLITVFSRLLPHYWNFTAMMSASLLCGQAFNKRLSIPFVWLCLFISDILLSVLYGYAILGSWMLFTYSGYALTTGVARFFPETKGSARVLALCGFTLFYWAWTNLGSFWAMYPHTLSGLSVCYISALPFLRSALLGNLIFLPILLLVFRYTGEPLSTTVVKHRHA